MIEVINKNLDVMCVPVGKIPAGWTLYTDRRKFPRPEGAQVTCGGVGEVDGHGDAVPGIKRLELFS